MTGGRWHWTITLPGGERVTADHRDPIAPVIERAWRDPELSDLTAIMEFYRQNRQQVESCQRGDCSHDVQ